MLDIKYHFIYWQIKPTLNYCKCLGFLSFFFFNSMRLSWLLGFLKIALSLLKKKVLRDKAPPPKVKGFLTSSSDLGKICETGFTKNFSSTCVKFVLNV